MRQMTIYKDEIKRCKEFLKKENTILPKRHYRERLKYAKDELLKAEKSIKENELDLVKWQIREFQANNEKFKIIKGGVN